MDKNKDSDNKEEKEEIVNNIRQMGAPNISNFQSSIQFLTIIGEIEGHNISSSDKKTTKYEHIIPILIAAVQDPNIKGIFIILNTVGGDVEAGLALAEMINSIDKPKVSLVLGGGHSIGVPLATASDYSFIVPTAAMTIHPIRTTGLVIGVPQTFRYFEKMQQRIIDFILRTSNINKKDLIRLMYSTDELANDIGTILIGKEAVDYGIIDEVGGFDCALNKLNILIDNKYK
ncbi:ATP-dependent Clp protease proteolytic subunit ClpP [Keratinibaculum paraultunense]|uniref:ATP-dependent Clp protease proteolytic subunit ClpP n=1 Tax=Keratinibaculum paraultunense TaxID=1278232 RepID=A0A4R3KVQ0_9FIRM|nr:ATP-dependent Clp protease proteolytic subunit [Keratinibaculum paraultunense]QQY80686.1 ATP-dependent Clp protease proteolytic subunit [Keratinibaculum paraultunense]TCS89711.1 ATP-dependent Clp protease proteolytic subunit ClpP [Keratinibaculum paraultunense]